MVGNSHIGRGYVCSRKTTSEPDRLGKYAVNSRYTAPDDRHNCPISRRCLLSRSKTYQVTKRPVDETDTDRASTRQNRGRWPYQLISKHRQASLTRRVNPSADHHCDIQQGNRRRADSVSQWRLALNRSTRGVLIRRRRIVASPFANILHSSIIDLVFDHRIRCARAIAEWFSPGHCD